MKTLTLEQKYGVSFGYGLDSVCYAEHDIKILKNRRFQCARDRKEIKKLTAYVEERRRNETSISA